MRGSCVIHNVSVNTWESWWNGATLREGGGISIRERSSTVWDWACNCTWELRNYQDGSLILRVVIVEVIEVIEDGDESRWVHLIKIDTVDTVWGSSDTVLFVGGEMSNGLWFIPADVVDALENGLEVQEGLDNGHAFCLRPIIYGTDAEKSLYRIFRIWIEKKRKIICTYTSSCTNVQCADIEWECVGLLSHEGAYKLPNTAIERSGKGHICIQELATIGCGVNFKSCRSHDAIVESCTLDTPEEISVMGSWGVNNLSTSSHNVNG